MAMQYIDVTGKTENEAIEKALQQLGRDRDDVSVEILERAKSGFLGLGASPAKVRVTYEDGKPEAPAPQEKKEPKPAAREEEKTRPAAPREEKPQQEKPREEKRETPKAAQDKPRREKKPAREEKPVQEEKAAPAQELGEEIFDEKSQQIRAFLDGLMAHMDSDAKAKVYLPEKGRYKVLLEGSRMGQLIGRRGETLDAIQQLCNYSVNRGSDKRVRIQVDAEGYRDKREESLQRLAMKVAGKVVKYRKNVTLEPMNAYERHVIHTALQNVENVTTYSMGTEPNRRVVVGYDRTGGKGQQ